MMRLFGLCLLALTAVPSVAQAEDVKWLCLTDAAAGFTGSRGNWTGTTFKANKKYIFHRMKVLYPPPEIKYPPKYIFFLYELGAKGHDFCFMHIASSHFVCTTEPESRDRATQVFVMNPTSLRFTLTYVGEDFIDGKDTANPDTPSMEIGKCSRL